MISLNEEKAIARMVNDIRRVVPAAEIVIVDSSSDRTAEIATELGCVVVKQVPPKGYGPAMGKALTTASRDIVITLDCDDTYPVEQIHELIRKMHEGYDLVSASRLGARPDNMPYPNYLANMLFGILAGAICGVRSTDVHTGMRAYKKSLLDAFPYNQNGNALPVELQVGPAALGFKCYEFFIDYKPRIGESKLEKWSGAVWTVKRLWRWRFFFNPEKAKVKKEMDAKLAGAAK
jgi:glycosyltransferase involved in cell wall biosynthesis